MDDLLLAPAGEVQDVFSVPGQELVGEPPGICDVSVQRQHFVIEKPDMRYGGVEHGLPGIDGQLQAIVTAVVAAEVVPVPDAGNIRIMKPPTPIPGRQIRFWEIALDFHIDTSRTLRSCP